MALPPTPPMPPKLTALPPDARQAIEDANRAAREATATANQAAREAQKQAAAAAKEAAKQAKQNKNPDNQ